MYVQNKDKPHSFSGQGLRTLVLSRKGKGEQGQDKTILLWSTHCTYKTIQPQPSTSCYPRQGIEHTSTKDHFLGKD